MPNIPARPVPTDIHLRPVVISYSDGEGGSAGVGAAAWFPGHKRPVAVFSFVPQRIRDLWSRMAAKPEYKDIFLVEAVGPLILLTAFPKLLRDALWLHFIDNSAAEASLISGSSGLQAADHIVGLTWEISGRRRLWPYFDRVASSSNPVDGLSRGDFKGQWRGVHNVEFPLADLLQLADECGGLDF